VFLYRGPEDATIEVWRDAGKAEAHLSRHDLRALLNARLPLILPETLTISSIRHSDTVVRVTAVERHDYFERDEALDETTQTATGETVEKRAYVHYVKRGWPSPVF